MSAGSGNVFGSLPPILDPEGRIIDPELFVRSQAALGKLRASCTVYFNGQDITSALDPRLLMIRITDRQQGQSTCEIEVDDSYGQVPNPPDGAKISISIGYPNLGSYKQFQGSLEDVTSAGSRHGGRTLTVLGTGGDNSGLGKTPFSMSWGAGNDGGKDGGQAEEKTFEEVAKDIANKAGIMLTISPRIAQIKRKFWEIRNESPFSALERLSKELGGAFKSEGINGGITDLKDTVNAFGEALYQVQAVVGENVIGWRIKPKINRPQWGKLAHGFFDRDKSNWKNALTDVPGGQGFGNVAAMFMGQFPQSNADNAGQVGGGDAVLSVAQRGTGWVALDGEPRAMANAFLEMHGARPGVDGKYRNVEVEHTYVRGGGFITRVDVNSPELLDPNSVTGAWGTP